MLEKTPLFLFGIWKLKILPARQWTSWVNWNCDVQPIPKIVYILNRRYMYLKRQFCKEKHIEQE